MYGSSPEDEMTQQQLADESFRSLDAMDDQSADASSGSDEGRGETRTDFVKVDACGRPESASGEVRLQSTVICSNRRG